MLSGVDQTCYNDQTAKSNQCRNAMYLCQMYVYSLCWSQATDNSASAIMPRFKFKT